MTANTSLPLVVEKLEVALATWNTASLRDAVEDVIKDLKSHLREEEEARRFGQPHYGHDLQG